MARITPSEGRGGPSGLEDDASYRATLVKIDWSTSSPEYGSERRLQLDWLPEGAEEIDTQRDWISLRLGKQQNGTVSKLRQLLNAIHGQPSTTEIAWFDDDTLEFSYDGKTPADVLAIGREVIFEGVNGTKADGSPKFSIQRYKKIAATPAAKPAAAAEPAKRTPQPVGTAVSVDPDEIPF